MDKHPAIENLRTNQTQLDADGCMVGVSRQAVEETLAEIASLRADLDEARNGVRNGIPTRWVAALQKEVAGLRTELAARDELIAVLQNALSVAIDKCDATARQDAEEIARLKEDRTTELRNEFEGIRSELETTKRQSFVEGLNEAQRQYYPRVERLEAAARQDAEEKARLKEVLILARKEISDHDSDYHHRTRESTIEAIRAALACRPQAEPATNLFNKDGSMRIEGACRPQGEKSDVP